MIRRTALPLAAAALLAGCNAPDLEPTEGGYVPGMVPAAADPGAAVPHEGPAAPDSAAAPADTARQPGSTDAS